MKKVEFFVGAWYIYNSLQEREAAEKRFETFLFERS